MYGAKIPCLEPAHIAQDPSEQGGDKSKVCITLPGIHSLSRHAVAVDMPLQPPERLLETLQPVPLNTVVKHT